jgi:hypothetical protein
LKSIGDLGFLGIISQCSRKKEHVTKHFFGWYRVPFVSRGQRISLPLVFYSFFFRAHLDQTTRKLKWTSGFQFIASSNVSTQSLFVLCVFFFWIAVRGSLRETIEVNLYTSVTLGANVCDLHSTDRWSCQTCIWIKLRESHPHGLSG